MSRHSKKKSNSRRSVKMQKRIDGHLEKINLIRIIKRTTDFVGQMFLTPDHELDGWWTTLSEDNYNDDHIILLYENHATSEQFHSEFKTDMDLERPPFGKFDTNDLAMCLGALAYNIVRHMGQASLLGPESPIRHSAARRRIKTVIQNLILRIQVMVKHRLTLVYSTIDFM